MRKRTNPNSTSGITFLEIMIAMVIMATALLPIFSMINKGTADTDVNHSMAFAIGRASDVLNTMLDSVPFEAIRSSGNIAILSTQDLNNVSGPFNEYNGKIPGRPPIPADFAMTLTQQLFGTEAGREVDVGGGKKGYQCTGKLTDPRGISYRIQMLCEDLGDTQKRNSLKEIRANAAAAAFPAMKEVTFNFLMNPKKLSQPNWVVTYASRTNNVTDADGARFEYELKASDGTTALDSIAVPNENIYAMGDYTDPGQVRMVTHHLADRNRYAAEPTTPGNPMDGVSYCVFKRLIVEVKWCMDQKYFGNPDADQIDAAANIQRVHLMTLKTEISR